MSDLFAPYKETYVDLQGPGDSRPTALQVVKDNDLIDRWAGKVALITGATSGIGIETARALHATGADVYITARNKTKAVAALDSLRSRSNGKGKLDYILMELDSLDSVREGAREFLAKSDKLNILVNNAGIMGNPETKTVDGFEIQFAVNHLAHFTLTATLLPTLLASSTPSFNSRVIAVSSSSHRYTSIHFDNFNLTGIYDPFLAYGQSKLANVWMTNYIDRVYGPKGVHALSLHPGGIWTSLQQHSDPSMIEKWKSEPETVRAMLNTEQGAATSTWAAVAKVWEGKGGKYLTNTSIAPPATDLNSTMDPGVAPHAYDEDGENRLWELSLKLTGVSVK